MATPIIATDASDFVEADVVNQFIAGPGSGKINVKTHWAAINESGATFVVNGAFDSGGIVTGDLTFNAANDSLEITLAGFVNPPVIMVVARGAATTYYPWVFSSSAVLADIRFRDIDTGAAISTGVIAVDMSLNVFIIGF